MTALGAACGAFLRVLGHVLTAVILAVVVVAFLGTALVIGVRRRLHPRPPVVLPEICDDLGLARPIPENLRRAIAEREGGNG